MASHAQVVAAAPSFRLAWKDGRPRARVDYRRQTGEGECTYWLKLSEWSDAIGVIEGTEEEITLSTSPLITAMRYVPLVHPYEPRLYFSSYDWELWYSTEEDDPDIDDSGDQVKLTLRFDLPEFGLSGEPYQQISIIGNETVENTDGAGFSGGSTPSYQVGNPLPGMSYSVTVYDAVMMDESHENYLRSMAGRLNNAPWRGNPVGTVRYHSPRINYGTKRDGTRTANYSLQFDAKPRDWNLESMRDGTLAELLIGGSPRFGYMDFSTLFV